MSVSLTIVLPAFNEESIIIRALDAHLQWSPPTEFALREIIVVDDGSRDRTRQLVESYSLKFPMVRLISHRQNAGKGAALASGVSSATGDVIGCVDADLAYPPDVYADFLTAFLDRTVDIAIGNRYHSEQQSNHKTMVRRCASMSFRTLISLLRLTPFADTQCGIKFFRHNPAAFLFGHLKSRGFLFDLDLLSLASSVGMVVREIPVRANSGERSSIRVHRQILPVITALLRIMLSRRNRQSIESLRLQWKSQSRNILRTEPDKV